MGTFLLSLDEIARVKKAHRIEHTTELAERTNVSRKTWTTALKTRRATPDILAALANLGARPDKVLILDDAPIQAVSA
ncbi:XRE family transcriptional regulator [Gordonia sp. LUNF6]|uniref:XRE family transcriptional regulator n=1 Tax=Gordonia sp. LUNF6 TaxID=3388658 RepID=UPI003999975D